MWKIRPAQVSLGVWMPSPLLSGRGLLKCGGCFCEIWTTWQMVSYHWPQVKVAEVLCAPVSGPCVTQPFYEPSAQNSSSVIVTGEILHTLMILGKMKASSLLILMT